MANLQDARTLARLVTAEIWDYVQKNDLDTVVEANSPEQLAVMANIIKVTENRAQVAACSACADLFVGPWDQTDNKGRMARAIRRHYKETACRSQCVISISNVKQVASLRAQTDGSVKFTGPVTDVLVRQILGALRKSDVRAFRHITQEQVQRLLEGDGEGQEGQGGQGDQEVPSASECLERAFASETSSRSMALATNTLQLEGAGTSVRNVSQSVVLDTFFGQYLAAYGSLLGTTLDEALDRECEAIRRAVDDSFRLNLAKAWSAHQTEYLAVLLTSVVLAIAFLVIRRWGR